MQNQNRVTTSFKNALLLIGALVFCLLLCSCSVGTLTVIPAGSHSTMPEGTKRVTGIKLNLTETTLPLGDSTLLVAIVTPLDAADRSVRWASDDPAIASVDENGRITGRGRGKTVITASAGDGSIRAICRVTVKGSQNYNNDGSVKVQGVNISRTSMNMSVGGTAQITASVYPADALNQKITFINSNSRVVNLEDGGMVTAISPGRAVITAISEDGQKTASCEIQVLAYLTGMRLNAEYLSLAPGQTSILRVIPEPENATNLSFTWSTSNPKIASVGTDGKVTAVAMGNVTITAKSADGRLSAKCLLTVEPRSDFIPLSNFEIQQKEGTVAAGECLRIYTVLQPENTTEADLVFRSSDATVAHVSAGGIVTGMKEGSATITVSGKGGAITRNIKITVLKSTVARQLYISHSELQLSVGGNQQLDVGISGKLQEGETVLWMSTNPSVVKVDENGKLTAMSIGSATVVASLSVTGNAAKCTVNVANNGVTAVTLNKTALELAVGKSQTLIATVLPANATVKAVNWFSSDESVAKVDRKGNVTAVGSGRAIITVRTVDSKRTATCTVTVPNTKITGIKLSDASLTLAKGDARALYIMVEPSGADAGGLNWSSSNTKIVTVSEDGLVTAVSDGTATVTVSAGNGIKSSCTVTVKTVPVERISLAQGSLTLTVGDSTVIKVTVYPLDASDRRVKFQSSNEAVVKVDAKGKVTAIGKGFATVTVTSYDGRISRICAIEVR